LEISRAAKNHTADSQQRMKDNYEKLLAITQGVVRQATQALQKWENGKLKVVGNLWAVRAVERQMGQLRQFVPLVEKVMMQTVARVWQGNTHVVGKVLSLLATEVCSRGPSLTLWHRSHSSEERSAWVPERETA
jgi:methanogenic corrinoid protein MtbC1